MPRLFLLLACYVPLVSSFALQGPKALSMSRASALASTASAHLIQPTERDERYGTTPMNVAQYLVDLHDAEATFDFCGGMMFQLVLSNKLREHLARVAKQGSGAPVENPDDKMNEQPVIYDSSKSRMFQIPEYSETGDADNIRVFHGREIRKVPSAKGGMGFVLQLSYAGEDDPEGWTPQEVAGYDGWKHDVGRTWRKGERLEEEGFKTFRKDFGKDAFALHHRFYLHFDAANRMWLSAEDGCEGTPSKPRPFLSRLFG